MEHGTERLDDELASRLRTNLEVVRERIGKAARRAGRDPSEVTLVAVTKSVGSAEILELARLGVADFGENRTDALLAKRELAEREGVRATWHMIGNFQTNKVRRALPAIDVLHSLDRDSLLAELAKELRPDRDVRLPAFVQVNVSGEASKGGYSPTALAGILARVGGVPGLAVTGLMTMAPLGADPDSARPVFRRLRELRDEAHSRGYLHAPNLSMGMSQDFEIAVEEGATHVRVGSILFKT
jgi:PLP dependent protein